MKNIYTVIFFSLVCSYINAQQPCPGIPTVDYGGQTYHTVAIGDQCWLKENLNVGTMINSKTGGSNGDGQQTNNGTIEKYCYDNNPNICTTFGGLYQWDEMMQYVTTEGTQGICPTGWHIPTYSEFQTLAVGNNSNSLKAIGQDETSTNTSGFSALMAGYRSLLDDFFYLAGSTFFWSSTEYGATNKYYMNLNSNGSNIYFNRDNKDYGFSVRCLNDSSVSTMPVELGLFTAVVDGRTVQLNWETKTEKNSNKFDIERKMIDTDWRLIGSVKSADLSNSPKQYSFADKNLQSGKYQYRLKMIDNDGTFEYSKVVEAEVAVPKNYELSQNFPNPFNPNTVIFYSLPLASGVRLIVYNSLGQTISVLENGYKNAGTYSVNFNATELSSGTYFYKIEAGQFSQIKKMILIK